MKILIVQFSNMLLFYDEWLLAPRSTTTLEAHPMPAVCDFLFSISAAALPISSIRDLRTRQAVVTTGPTRSADHWTATSVP
jgi:hypothetical protein